MKILYKFIFCILIIQATPIYSDIFHNDIVCLKNYFTGPQISYLEKDIIEIFSKDYIYEEVNVYDKVPLAAKDDIIKIYDYTGLEYMFYHSTEYFKHYLYYFEINDNYYLKFTNIKLGITYNEFIKKYGNNGNYRENSICYGFDGGDLFFIFNEELQLYKIYWCTGW